MRNPMPKSHKKLAIREKVHNFYLKKGYAVRIVKNNSLWDLECWNGQKMYVQIFTNKKRQAKIMQAKIKDALIEVVKYSPPNTLSVIHHHFA